MGKRVLVYIMCLVQKGIYIMAVHGLRGDWEVVGEIRSNNTVQSENQT